MSDAVVDILHDLYRDMSDRSFFDSIDDEVMQEMFSYWYAMISARLDPDLIPESPSDILKQVRGY